MADLLFLSRRLDRLAIGLSAVCALHCVATIVLIGALSSLGHVFTLPVIHEAGLALAVLIGAIALGAGIRRHRLLLPSLIGVAGLALMALGLVVPHGRAEAIMTIGGVAVVALAHFLNIRGDRRGRLLA